MIDGNVIEQIVKVLAHRGYDFPWTSSRSAKGECFRTVVEDLIITLENDRHGPFHQPIVTIARERLSGREDILAIGGHGGFAWNPSSLYAAREALENARRSVARQKETNARVLKILGMSPVHA